MHKLRYQKTIFQIIKMSHQQAIAFRVDYLLRIIRALMDIGLTFIVISLFYLHAEKIGGWNKYEVSVVFALFQMISSGVFMCTGYGIEQLKNLITYGKLDRYLAQPIDSQFAASSQMIFITMGFRVVFAVAILAYALVSLHYSPSLLQIALTVVSTISSLAIYYSFLFIASSLAFWIFSGEMWQLAETVTRIGRYPVGFFPKREQVILHLVPLAFISTIPAQALLGKTIFLALISPVIGLIMLKITRLVWNAGLRSYQSASS